jgi:hypothetical protein
MTERKEGWKCLDLGLCHCDENTCVCERGKLPKPDQPHPDSPGTQQAWRERVLGQLLLIQDVVLQSLTCNRVRRLC